MALAFGVLIIGCEQAGEHHHVGEQDFPVCRFAHQGMRRGAALVRVWLARISRRLRRSLTAIHHNSLAIDIG